MTTRDSGPDEVVQLYVQDAQASVPVPLRHLEGFQRVPLRPGETVPISFTLRATQLRAYADDGTAFLEPGAFFISVGGGQPRPGKRGRHDNSEGILTP